MAKPKKQGKLIKLPGAQDAPVETPSLGMGNLIRRLGITASIAQTDDNPGWPSGTEADHWSVIFKLGRRKLEVPYSLVKSHGGRPPLAEEVLECLAIDANTFESAAGNFKTWCAEFGYPEDARAHRLHDRIGGDTLRLRKFIGKAEDYKALLAIGSGR